MRRKNKIPIFVTGLIVLLNLIMNSNFVIAEDNSILYLLNKSNKTFMEPIEGKVEFSGGINLKLYASANKFFLNKKYNFRLDIEMNEIPSFTESAGKPDKFLGSSTLFLIENRNSYSISNLKVKVEGRTVKEAVADAVASIKGLGSIKALAKYCFNTIKKILLNQFKESFLDDHSSDYNIEFDLPDATSDLSNTYVWEIAFSKHNINDFKKASISFDIEFSKTGNHSLFILPSIIGTYLVPTSDPGIVKITGTSVSSHKPIFYHLPKITNLTVQNPVTKNFMSDKSKALRDQSSREAKKKSDIIKIANVVYKGEKYTVTIELKEELYFPRDFLIMFSRIKCVSIKDANMREILPSEMRKDILLRLYYFIQINQGLNELLEINILEDNFRRILTDDKIKNIKAQTDVAANIGKVWKGIVSIVKIADVLKKFRFSPEAFSKAEKIYQSINVGIYSYSLADSATKRIFNEAGIVNEGDAPTPSLILHRLKELADEEPEKFNKFLKNYAEEKFSGDKDFNLAVKSEIINALSNILRDSLAKAIADSTSSYFLYQLSKGWSLKAGISGFKTQLTSHLSNLAKGSGLTMVMVTVVIPVIFDLIIYENDLLTAVFDYADVGFKTVHTLKNIWSEINEIDIFSDDQTKDVDQAYILVQAIGSSREIYGNILQVYQKTYDFGKTLFQFDREGEKRVGSLVEENNSIITGLKDEIEFLQDYLFADLSTCLFKEKEKKEKKTPLDEQVKSYLNKLEKIKENLGDVSDEETDFEMQYMSEIYRSFGNLYEKYSLKTHSEMEINDINRQGILEMMANVMGDTFQAVSDGMQVCQEAVRTNEEFKRQQREMYRQMNQQQKKGNQPVNRYSQQKLPPPIPPNEFKQIYGTVKTVVYTGGVICRGVQFQIGSPQWWEKAVKYGIVDYQIDFGDRIRNYNTIERTDGPVIVEGKGSHVYCQAGVFYVKARSINVLGQYSAWTNPIKINVTLEEK